MIINFLLTFDHSKEMVDKMLDGLNVNVLTSFKKKQSIMKKSFIAIAASGSVSLELCRYQVPTIIVYDTHFVTKILLKMLVKVKYASLINIIYNKEILPEFLFEKFNKENVFNELSDLISNKKKRLYQIRMMKDLSKKMILENKSPSDIISKIVLD